MREAVLDPARTALRRAVDHLEAADGAELTRAAAVARLRALSGQLRAAVESTRAGASEGRRAEPADPSGTHVLRDPWEILRANLTLRSAVLRHAIRLALLIGSADAVVRAAGLDRGYWVPLTLLVVMRPDFASTWQRASLRVLGTVVGLLLATELVHLLPAGDWWRVGLVLVLTFGMRLAGPGNVALTAVGLSGLVVVLLQIQGVPARDAVASRALDTVIGGVLAVLAVALLLPAWERRFVGDRMDALLQAYRGYLDVVADLGAGRAELHRARAASRLARSNAQASVDRAAAEPVEGRRQVELGRAVLAHTHRFIHAMLALDAVRVPLREAGGLRELTEFLTAAGDVLDVGRRSLATGEPPATPIRLRPRQEALRAAVERAGRIDPGTASAVVEASDRVANSLDTLLAELRRQHSVASPG